VYLFNQKNWRRLLLGALIVASKVWEDDAVWNEDFLQPFPSMQIADLGELERSYLNGLQFSVTLKPSVYAEYYFRLRALSTGNDQIFEPLDAASAQRLYDRSHGLEVSSKLNNSGVEARRKSGIRKTQSVDAFVTTPPPLSAEQISFPKNEKILEEEDF